MIILDYETESFVFDEAWDTVIPLEYKKTDGELVITAFPSVEGVAREFEERFARDPFSEAAFEWLRSALAPFFKEWGYRDEEAERLHFCYAADDPKAINTKAILPQTDFVEYDPEFRIFWDEEGDPIYQDDDRLYIGIIEDGELAAYAVTCARYDRDLPGPIAVETAALPEYRGRGYEVSALAALTLYICQNGQRAEFSCPAEDIAGQAAAESAGLSRVGRQYFYIGRKMS